MASVEDIATLRRITNEPGIENYSDESMSEYIDVAGSVDGAAAIVWEEKAARASNLVNIAESGSSRSMNQIYQNAVDQAKFYQGKITTEGETSTAPFVTQITRP